MINQFLQELFDGAKFKKEEFAKRNKQSSEQDFEPYLASYKLTEQEKMTKTNLRQIVTAPMFLENPSRTTINPLSQGKTKKSSLLIIN